MATHSLRARALVALIAIAAAGTATAQPKATLATAAVRADSAAAAVSHEGVVEAVRQTVLAAQVPGAVVTLNVKVGDAVRAGQVLLRLDGRAAEQTAAAGAAQVTVARAAQEIATREFERQRQLFAKNYISQAALERAEAQYKAAQAQAQAQLASAGAARTQTGFYVVVAPYGGIVAEVPVVLGDMAMPGRPLVTLYDPSSLRVSARVPQTVAQRLDKDAPVQVELAGATPVKASGWQLHPTADPASHTIELRVDLPAQAALATPGTFARVWLPDSGQAGRLYVPREAVVRRSELAGVYVIGADGRALLRQVRLGRTQGQQVEILAGVNAGERVALDPQAAARAAP